MDYQWKRQTRHLFLTDLQVGPPLAHTELRLEAVPEMGYSPDDASGASGEVYWGPTASSPHDSYG